jgi:flagellar hook-associated protein 2
MGSSTTPLTSGPLTFTGVSSYSTDLQSILQRANQIAQLPVTALQNTQTDNVNKKAALIALNPAVANVGSAVAALGSLAANGGGLVASSSDSSTVSIANTGATSPATYTISSIQSLAASAWATTGNFADATTKAVSTSGYVDLTVGSNTYHLNLTGTGNNNLSGLENAINNAGAGVTASILTTGGGDYLSISASTPGQAAIQLQAVPNPVDLITNTDTGTDTTAGRYANSTTTPVSTGGHMSLVVGSSTYALDLSGAGANNLTGLENAINGASAGVTASISSDAKGYYLAISTNDSSAQTLQLNDTSANLISTSNAGSNADFMLNGNIHIVQASNVVNNVIPGVTFTLQNTTTGATSVTLSLANNPGQISTALQTFVANYNTLAAQVAQQVGTTGGPLVGNMLIQNIMSDTQQLGSYWNPSNTSSVRSLADLGITFADLTGQLTFDPTVFNNLSSTQLSDAMRFLGSSKSGFAALANNFTQLSDPVTGLILSQENSYDSANTQITDQINSLNARITVMENAETAKIQAADALIAQLQSDQNTVNASIQSLNYVAFGKLTSANGQ